VRRPDDPLIAGPAERRTAACQITDRYLETVKGFAV